VRNGASQESGLKLAWPVDIINELARTLQERRIFEAGLPTSDVGGLVHSYLPAKSRISAAAASAALTML
jgi:hypothetical protein